MTNLEIPFVWNDDEKFGAAFVKNLELVDGRKFSFSEFQKRWTENDMPVIFTHLIDEWEIINFSLEDFQNLFNNTELTVKYRQPNDTNKEKVKMIFEEYLNLIKNFNFDMCDDKFAANEFILPYLFHHFKGDESILNLYHVPLFFQKDIFNTLPLELRPEYRWFVVGEKGSGTGIHIDPRGTSAWNALLQGHKRWLLFEDIDDDFWEFHSKINLSALCFFCNVYPYLEDIHGKVYEFIQHPGEVVYVPAGWAHVVLNLDFTICVTQNFGEIFSANYVYSSVNEDLQNLLLKHSPEFAAATENYRIDSEERL